MKKTTWNLKHLFKNDIDPEILRQRDTVRRKSDSFIRKWKSRTDYLRDPALLKQALDEYEVWRRFYGTDGNEGYYFWLRTSQDQNDPELKAKFNKIDEFSKSILNDIQFFHLRLAKIPRKRQEIFLKSPLLADYRHFLEHIFAESRYLLSEKEECPVLGEKSHKETKSFSEILSIMNSRHKKVRDSAARAFNQILSSHSATAEYELNSILSNKKVDDTLRGIKRPDTMRHLSDDIDTEIVDTLIETVADRFDISAEYYRLKASLLGVKKLKYHERNIEYGAVDKKYTYAQATKILLSVLKNLDRDFLDIFKMFIENGQFDIYPRKGKTGGAFCAHHLMSQPTYILLNYTERLNDILTLAHEVGHGINNELIKRAQHALNFGTPLCTAEVASTFLEDFVLQKILTQADDNLKLSLMMMKLNDDVSTIFRQVACYKFEQALHHNFRERGYLSGKSIGRLFQEHMSGYMGDAVEQSRGSENWWIYWGHIRSFFYVYSYASGLLISKSLQRSVKRSPSFIMKVKDFLSAGLSDSPKIIFLNLGIDISDRNFWKNGLDEIERLLKETRQLAHKIGKLSSGRLLQK
jgi:oligoendopeptidase F